VHQVGHYPELHQDARSTKYKKLIMYCAFTSANFHFQQNALCCLSILITHCLVLKASILEYKVACPGVRHYVPDIISRATDSFHYGRWAEREAT
jgi:hypothetical protein